MYVQLKFFFLPNSAFYFLNSYSAIHFALRFPILPLLLLFLFLLLLLLLLSFINQDTADMISRLNADVSFSSFLGAHAPVQYRTYVSGVFLSFSFAAFSYL